LKNFIRSMCRGDFCRLREPDCGKVRMKARQSLEKRRHRAPHLSREKRGRRAPQLSLEKRGHRAPQSRRHPAMM